MGAAPEVSSNFITVQIMVIDGWIDPSPMYESIIYLG